MQNRTLRLLAALALSGGLFSAGAAAAQDMNPEEGGVWVPPPDDTQTAPPPVQPQPPPPQPQPQTGTPAWYQGGAATTQATPPPDTERPPSQSSSSSSSASDSDGRDDHQRVVGRVAFGFMGLTSVPIGTPDGGGLALDTVSAPAIGIRYWVGELVGVDVGLGIGFSGGNVDSGSASAPLDNSFALTIHGGLPLALFHAQHYKFLIIPEINIGFSTGTAFGATQDQDRGRSGFLFQIGGRIGTEIHFGFMDVPQLSLQASVGLFFDYSQAGVGGSRAGADSTSVSAYGIATSVQGEPWDILLGSLNALYYF